MSVLIKGMKMPEECLDCPMCDINDDCVLQKDERFDTWEEQKKDCPLIEVPEPHGDLIDRDALRIAELDTLIMIRYKLAYAPTVIEAEGSENHDD